MVLKSHLNVQSNTQEYVLYQSTFPEFICRHCDSSGIQTILSKLEIIQHLQAGADKRQKNIVKRKFFWRKLIFKTKAQERDFIVSFEGMPKKFKGTYPSTQCVIDYTEYFCQRPRPSTFNLKFLLFELKAPCYKYSNLIKNFYQQFMVRI